MHQDCEDGQNIISGFSRPSEQYLLVKWQSGMWGECEVWDWVVCEVWMVMGYKVILDVGEV